MSAPKDANYPTHDVVLEKRGLKSECKWSLDNKDKTSKECPHDFTDYSFKGKIADSWIDCVGNTPLIRLKNIAAAEGLECELIAKCEFLNPNGSVKDRIAKRMIVQAEKDGTLKKGDCLIEPTSGNTGLGLAAAAASRGYKCIICLLEKMSVEKIDALKGFGAEIVKRPTHLPMYHADGIFGTSMKLMKRLHEKGEGAAVLNQYSNPSNPLAHYMTTGQEIWDQCDGRLDYLVATMGTGGTMTGISRALKEHDPNIKVVGVDPPGSILSGPEHF